VGNGVGRIEHCTDAMHAKAKTILHAVTFAFEAGMSRSSDVGNRCNQYLNNTNITCL
jgi:hypothetical protein